MALSDVLRGLKNRKALRSLWMDQTDGPMQGTTENIKFYQDEDLNPRDHIRNLKFSVPIDSIYRFVDHYAENESSLFCAVLCEVVDKKLLEMVGNKYVLKVFNDKGVCLFQRYINALPKMCALFQNILIYVCNQDDDADDHLEEDDQVIHLVRFADNQVTTLHRVKVANDFDIQSMVHVGFFDNFLFFTTVYFLSTVTGVDDFSETEMQMWSIDCREFLDQTYSEPCQTTHSITAKYLFSPKMNVKQFVDLGHSNFTELEDGSTRIIIKQRLGVIFEEPDSGIAQFYELKIKNKDGDMPDVSFVSLHDQEVKRDRNQDYFIKSIENRMCIDPVSQKLFHATAVHRCATDNSQEGHVDLYYNFRLVQTLDGLYEDIDASFIHFYVLSKATEEQESQISTVAISWKEMMGDTVKRTIKMSKENDVEGYWERNKHYAVQKYVKLYTSFFQLKNIFVIAHDRFISIFHLTNEFWFHIELSDVITDMETNYYTINPNEDDKHQLNCLLESGQMETLHMVLNQPITTNAPLGIVITSRETRKSPGFVQDRVFDTELNSACLLLCDRQVACKESSQLYYSHDQSIPRQARHCSQVRLPRQRGQEAALYMFADGKYTELQHETLTNLPATTKITNQYQCDSEIKEFYLQTQSFCLDIYLKFTTNLKFSMDQVHVYQLEPQDGQDEFYKGCKNLQAVVQPSDKVYRNHAYLIADGDLLILRAHVEETEDQDDSAAKARLQIVHRTNGMNLRAAVALGDDYIYVVSDGFNDEVKLADGTTQKGQFHFPGVYCLDGKAFLVDKINHSILIRDTLGGVNSQITVNASWDRFAYIRNYEQIELLPVAHSNLIEYIGMPPPSQILARREEKGTFALLTNQGHLYAWSELTAKQVMDRIDVKKIIEADLGGDGVQRNLTDFVPHPDSPVQEFQDHSVSLLVHKTPLTTSQVECRETESIEHVEFLHKGAYESLGLHTYAAIRMYEHKAEVAFTFKLESLDYREKNMLYGKEQGVEKYKDQITFSQDLERMLHIKNDGHCFIRQREWVDEAKKVARWKTIYQVNNLPQALITCNHNTLFTPDFTFHLDIDYRSQEWVIIETATNEEVYRVPKEVFSSIERGQKQNKGSLFTQAQRMYFSDSEHLRVLSKDNIDVLYNFVTGEIESYCKIDKLAVSSSYKHFYKEGSKLDFYASSQRLARCCMKFRQEVALQHKLESEALYTLNEADKASKLAELRLKLSAKIFKTQQAFDDDYEADTFMAEHSYTLLDWLIVDKIVTEEDYDFRSKLTGPQLVKLCFNIFPNQMTIWHYIAKSELGANLDLTKALFEESQKEWPEFNNVKQILPIIRDSSGMSAIDWAFKNQYYNKHFVQDFLANIKDYPIFSYGRVIEYAVVNSVKHGHSGISEFMDARLKKFGHFHAPEWSKNKLKDDRKYKLAANQRVTASTISPLTNRGLLQEQLFDSSVNNDVLQRKDISTRIFDIPDLHINKTLAGNLFMNALAQTDDISVFASKAVQVIIKERWRDIRMRLWLGRIVPYFINFFIFTYWSIYVIPKLDRNNGSEYSNQNVLCAFLLVVFAVFTLIYHVFNFIRLSFNYKRGWLIYFNSWWNYLEVIPAFLLLVFTIIRLSESRDGDRLSARDSQILSVICLCFWLQMLNFIRIPDWSGYLVRMILLCFYDVRIFGFIFTLGMLAFGNSFYLLGRQLNLDPEATEAGRLLHEGCEEPAPEPIFPNYFQAVMYTYKAAMGDWDTDAFGENNNSTVLLWFYWLLITIVAMIVLLNLLIAIVSETFNDVLGTSNENSYFEKAKLIRDLQTTQIEAPQTQARFIAVAFYPYLKEKENKDD